VIGIARSHYPFIELRRLAAGFANEVQTSVQADELQESSWAAAVRIAKDIELMDEAGEGGADKDLA